MTLVDWYHTTWFYQHWLVFVLPFTALYGAMAAFACAFFGGMNMYGRLSLGVSLLLWAHVAIAIASVGFWVYNMWLIWH